MKLALALLLGAFLLALGALGAPGASEASEAPVLHRVAPPLPGSATPAVPGGLPDGLFQPAFVLAHAEEAGLDEGRVAAIEALAAEVDDADRADQPERFRIAEELTALVSAPDVDEAAAARLIDEALELERASRRRGLLLLVRVKNELDPEQVKRLTAIREALVFETGGVR